MKRCVVIGAGIGGLTAGAVLARAGVEVTVLEAQVYPGGCAGTFFHQNYRFDIGATCSAGFYSGGPMEYLAKAAGIEGWNGKPADTIMSVHLPESRNVVLFSDDRRWQERSDIFGREGDHFWSWQERTADAVWDFSRFLPNWPPQTIMDMQQLASQGFSWLSNLPRPESIPGIVADAFRPVSSHMRGTSESLKLFIDGQLLISAQALSHQTNALYGAAALDFARRGVVHFEGGIGSIANVLVKTIHQNGGQVHFRQEVSRIVAKNGHPVVVQTRRGNDFLADVILANLTPPNIENILANSNFDRQIALAAPPEDGWGAFMIYAGLDASVIPAGTILHHQILGGRPLGEGNSIFISFSPEWDQSRAPGGHRSATISTHTRLSPWWQSIAQGKASYGEMKDRITEKVLDATETIFPGFRQGIKLIISGTPVTFQRFTDRVDGWVGGYPQTSLFRAQGPRVAPGLWMVGDSVFPGQSIAAVAMSGLRVANLILREVK